MEKDVKSALDNALRWWDTSKKSYYAGNYDNSVYAMEMSLEIGLKAVLIKNGIDYPKIHDITGVIRMSFPANMKGNGLEQKEIDNMLDTMQVLLRYRNSAGYMFSNNISMETLKHVADDNINKVKRYLEILNRLLD